VKPRVVINADDFGLSPGVNRAIADSFRQGVLTSATALVNMPHFNEAAALARELPGLGVGVHLTLLWGRPVSDPASVPSLVDESGALGSSLGTLARRYVLGRLSPAEVRAEFGNQIRAFLAAGLVPTHVDTHKHVHALPGVLDAVLEAARGFGIDKVRLPVEQRNRTRAPRPPSWKAAAKRDLLRFLFRGARAKLRALSFRTTDQFAGLDYQERLDAGALLHALSQLRSGTTEIMCHPGYTDAVAAAFSRRPPPREVEAAALCDPRVREVLASGTVLPIHYGDL
jgi:hopanoid biosynthesis associated protein HpnK